MEICMHCVACNSPHNKRSRTLQFLQQCLYLYGWKSVGFVKVEKFLHLIALEMTAKLKRYSKLTECMLLYILNETTEMTKIGFTANIGSKFINLLFVWRQYLSITIYKLTLPFGAGIIVFFLILAHPVYKMWIIQEPNTLELWNKLHFEERKERRVYTMFKIFSTYICWIKI